MLKGGMWKLFEMCGIMRVYFFLKRNGNFCCVNLICFVFCFVVFGKAVCGVDEHLFFVNK